MEKQKEQQNRGWVTWVLWSATILTIVLLILFREDENREIGVLASDRVAILADSGIMQQENRLENADETNVINEIQNYPDAEDTVQTENKPEEELLESKPEEVQSDAETIEAEAEAETPESDSEEMIVTEETETTQEMKKRELDPDKPMIALTFDDGPYRENTTSLLDLLEQYDARATFFVVGYHLDVFYEATLDAYHRGFQIGNHTASHPSLRNLSVEEALEEIRKLNEQLNDLGIPGDAMLRPPYGEFSAALKETVSVPMIGWNVDSQDWLTKDADKIYEQLIGKVKDGDIVLLHDLQDATVEAMQRVVPELVAQGFQLVTLDELFEAKGIEPEAGKYYCYIR